MTDELRTWSDPAEPDPLPHYWHLHYPPPDARRQPLLASYFPFAPAAPVRRTVDHEAQVDYRDHRAMRRDLRAHLPVRPGLPLRFVDSEGLVDYRDREATRRELQAAHDLGCVQRALDTDLHLKAAGANALLRGMVLRMGLADQHRGPHEVWQRLRGARPLMQHWIREPRLSSNWYDDLYFERVRPSRGYSRFSR